LKTITVIVSKEGQTRVEANGFAGGECRLATAKIRAALGQESDEQLKPEFASQPQSHVAHASNGAPLGS
jgi:hypothetical protein